MVAYTGGGAQGLSTRVNPPKVASNYQRQIEALNDKVKKDAQSVASEERQGRNLINALQMQDRMETKVTAYELDAYAKGFKGLTSLYENLVVKPTIKKNEELFAKGFNEATTNETSGRPITDEDDEYIEKIRTTDKDFANKTNQTAVQILEKTRNEALAKRLAAMPEAQRNGFRLGALSKRAEGAGAGWFGWKEDNKDREIYYEDEYGNPRTFKVGGPLDERQSRIAKDVFLQEYGQRVAKELGIHEKPLDPRLIQKYFAEPANKQLKAIQKEDEQRYRIQLHEEKKSERDFNLQFSLEKEGEKVVAKDLEGYIDSYVLYCRGAGQSSNCHKDALDHLQNSFANILTTSKIADKDGLADKIYKLASTVPVKGPGDKLKPLSDHWPNRFSKENIHLKALEIQTSIYEKKRRGMVVEAKKFADALIQEWRKQEVDEPPNKRQQVVDDARAAGKPVEYTNILQQLLVDNYPERMMGEVQADEHLTKAYDANNGIITDDDVKNIPEPIVEAWLKDNPDAIRRKNAFGKGQENMIKNTTNLLKGKVRGLIGAKASKKLDWQGNIQNKAATIVEQLQDELEIKAIEIQSQYSADNNGAYLSDGKAYQLAWKALDAEFDEANQGGKDGPKGRLTVEIGKGFTHSYWDNLGNINIPQELENRDTAVKRAEYIKDKLGAAKGIKGASGIEDYVVIDDPVLLSDPTNPTVVKIARMFDLSPTEFLNQQNELINTGQVIPPQPGEIEIQESNIVKTGHLESQFNKSNPNNKDMNKALAGTLHRQDQYITSQAQELEKSTGVFNPNVASYQQMASNTYPDKPILRFKEFWRLYHNLDSIDDPILGRLVHRARLNGLTFGESN